MLSIDQGTLHKQQAVQLSTSSSQIRLQSLQFGAQADSYRFSGTPKQKKPNVFQRFWQWLKELPHQWSRMIQNSVRRLWGKQPISLHSKLLTEPPKPALFSHIDPRLVVDPMERRRISVQLADETFDELLELYQNRHTYKQADGRPKDSHGLFEVYGAVLTPKAQKLLNTNTTATTSFFRNGSAPCGTRGEYNPPTKHVNGPDSSRDSLGHVELWPTFIQYDFKNPAHRQAAYETYLHEVEHMVHGYATNIAQDNFRLPSPSEDDPVKELYDDISVGSTQSGLSDRLGHILAKENPDLPDISVGHSDCLKRYNTESLQGYKEPLKRLWERADFPILNNPGSAPWKEKLDRFLDHSDPKLTKQWMHSYVTNELESYMTSFKRAPGIPKDQLYGCDFESMGAALHLRDLLRYYYQHPRHKVPVEEQHPFAQVKPLDEIWQQFNGTSL